MPTTAVTSTAVASPGPVVARMPRNSAADRTVLRTWLRLLSCTNGIEARVRAQLREKFDTTLPRFDLLAQLDAASGDSVQGLSMSDLSRRLMVTNGNVTGLVERLAQEGLVTRSILASDRRSQMVRLTAAGKRALDAMLPDHHSWISHMFAGLTESELLQLHTLLGKLKSSARKPRRSRATS